MLILVVIILHVAVSNIISLSENFSNIYQNIMSYVYAWNTWIEPPGYNVFNDTIGTRL